MLWHSHCICIYGIAVHFVCEALGAPNSIENLDASGFTLCVIMWARWISFEWHRIVFARHRAAFEHCGVAFEHCRASSRHRVTFRYRDFMSTCSYDHVILWTCDHMIMWWFGQVIIWSCGREIIWSEDQVVIWAYTITRSPDMWRCAHLIDDAMLDSW